jgi:hypothetical protein
MTAVALRIAAFLLRAFAAAFDSEPPASLS